MSLAQAEVGRGGEREMPLEVVFGPVVPALGADAHSAVHPQPRNAVGSIATVLPAGKLSHGGCSSVTDLGVAVP